MAIAVLILVYLLQMNTVLLQGTKGEIGVLGPPGPPGKKVLHPGVWHQRAHMHIKML